MDIKWHGLQRQRLRNTFGEHERVGHTNYVHCARNGSESSDCDADGYVGVEHVEACGRKHFFDRCCRGVGYGGTCIRVRGNVCDARIHRDGDE